MLANLWTQWPYLIVLLGGIVMSIVTMSRNPRASVLALSALSLMLIKSFVSGIILRSLISAMDHEQGVQVYSLIMTTWSAVALALLIVAVFVERNSVATLDSDLKVHEALATRQLKAGQTLDEIRPQLAQHNLNDAQIDTVLESAARKEVHRAGRRNLLIGVAILALGLLITIGTYLAAGQGGKYYVTHGLIIVGLIQSIRGLAQMGK